MLRNPCSRSIGIGVHDGPEYARKSQVSSDKTLERFDFAENPTIDRAYITDLATCRFVAEKVPVLI